MNTGYNKKQSFERGSHIVRYQPHLPKIILVSKTKLIVSCMTLKHFHQTAAHRIDQFLDFLSLDFFLQKQREYNISEFIYDVPATGFNDCQAWIGWRIASAVGESGLSTFPESTCAWSQVDVFVSEAVEIVAVLLGWVVDCIQFVGTFETIGFSVFRLGVACT